MKPTLYMMVGLPGSGKSTYANKYLKHEPSPNDMFPRNRCVVHSSDAIRAELFGDESSQEDNAKVFQVLHKRIREDLRNGVSVVYDACNIHKRRRIEFIQSLNEIECEKICCCIVTPFDICFDRQEGRNRQVPLEIIEGMYTHWTPPHESEGFDFIRIEVMYKPIRLSGERIWLADSHPFHWHLDKHYNYGDYKSGKFSLGLHMKVAAAYLLVHHPTDVNLSVAALLHDIGKPECESLTIYCDLESDTFDRKMRYHNHPNVSAYESFFYLNGFNDCDMIDISNLIYYHMHPDTVWKSRKALCCDTKLMGKEFIDRVKLLHKANKYAQC